MSNSQLIFPEDFADCEWELESKGWYSGARLLFEGKHYRLNFYDPGRLGQEIADELRRRGVHFEPNIVVVPAVTKVTMERAAEFLVTSGQAGKLAS